MFGIEVYQLYPQVGPLWRRDPDSGKRELFESYEAAAERAQALMEEDALRGFFFKAARYEEDQV